LTRCTKVHHSPGPLWVNRVDLEASALCPVSRQFQTWRFAIESVGPDVIQAPKLEPRIMRYELGDHEWVFIKPMHWPRPPTQLA